MKKMFVALTFVLAASSAQAASIPVWDTLSGVPLNGAGLVVGEFNQTNYTLAMPFTPSSSGYLSDVTIDAAQTTGTADWTLALYSNGSFAPGSVLETLPAIDVQPRVSGFGASYTSVASQTTFLSAGTGYWLVASMPDGNHGAWTVAPGLVGLLESSADGASFQTSNGVLTAIVRVEPNPVPLPAAVWLLISGFGAVGAFARRRRSGAAA